MTDLPIVVFDVHGVCNQSCAYCVARASQEFGRIVEPESVAKIKCFFSKHGPFNLLFTGGEPLITPNISDWFRFFVDCGHTISIQTNLKTGTDNLIESLPPEKTGWILASLHSVALRKLGKFLESAKMLKCKGYPLVVKMVLDKTMVKELEYIYENLTQDDIGVMLSPQICFPEKNRPHPIIYSLDEWELIIPRITLLSSWLYFAGGFKSRGRQCHAGSRAFYIRAHAGTISGCAHSFPSGLGDLYDNKFLPASAPVMCELDQCICDYNYYSGIISGLDDSEWFYDLTQGCVRVPSFSEFQQWIGRAGVIPLIDLEPIMSNVSAKRKKEYDYNKLRSVTHEFACHGQTPQPTFGQQGAVGIACATEPKILVEPQHESSITIPSVPVQQLHEELCFARPIYYPKSSLNKPLEQWKMEVDDSPIFRYIYRNFRPRRHLEFGTWQGAGTLYCLEGCDATVWTINLPGGENKSNGLPAYSLYPDELASAKEWAERIGMAEQDSYRTDCLGFIGRFYLEKGLGSRVCQIYGDSTKWDISNYPPGFFDTALIDGGHQKDIVINDTAKAFKLLRSGGLIMWHDFCPPIYDKFETTLGVMRAIYQQWEWINEQTLKLFWIYPSWILVGVKK